MNPLGASPPSFCVCGHDFHTGPCRHPETCESCICHCPDGELDGDR